MSTKQTDLRAHTTALYEIGEIIVPGDRLRDVSKAGVDYIANSFQVVGQLQSIIVTREHEGLVLRAGAHRLAAAKKLGWHHIEAKVYDLTGTPRRNAVIKQIVEVDENLGRVDLDQAGRARFMGKRFDLTQALAEADRADAKEQVQKELEAANLRAVEARRAKKKAKDAETKKKAEEAVRAAENVSATLSKRLAREEELGNSSFANEDLPSWYAQRGVASKVASDLGWKTGVVQNLNSFRNRLGDAYLKAVEGTRIGTQAELQCMVKLLRDFPERGEQVRARNIWLKDQGEISAMIPPSGELGKRTQEKQQIEASDALKTPEGKRENFRKVCVALQSEVAKLVQALGILDHGDRQNHHEVYRMQTDIAALVERTRKHGEQKRTGKEHRYGQEPDGPTRTEAEKELSAHRDEITRVLKEKTKKAKTKKETTPALDVPTAVA